MRASCLPPSSVQREEPRLVGWWPASWSSGSGAPRERRTVSLHMGLVDGKSRVAKPVASAELLLPNAHSLRPVPGSEDEGVTDASLATCTTPGFGQSVVFRCRRGWPHAAEDDTSSASVAVNA